MRRFGLSAGAASLALLCALSAAEADDAAERSTTDDWSFGFAPYLWFAGLEGDLSTLPPLPPVSVDWSFSDILENFDIGFMGVGEIRKGRFGVLVDLVYVDLEAEKATPRGIFFSNAAVEAKTFIGTFEASYRLVEEGDAQLDLLAGARVWSVETELSLGAGLLAARQIDHSETWADPIVGLRGRQDIGSGFYLTGWVNVGGFGVASDITWDVLGGIGYQIDRDMAMVLGYRHLEVDFEDDGFLFDVEQSGPVLGGVFRF
jgi:hypothetical protein